MAKKKKVYTEKRRNITFGELLEQADAAFEVRRSENKCESFSGYIRNLVREDIARQKNESL